ncbi:24711_t:CDS:2, partial [Racocetra persica]
SREESFMSVNDLNEESNSNNQISIPEVFNSRSLADPHFEYVNSSAKKAIDQLYIKHNFNNDNEILKDKDTNKLNNIIFR